MPAHGQLGGLGSTDPRGAGLGGVVLLRLRWVCGLSDHGRGLDGGSGRRAGGFRHSELHAGLSGVVWWYGPLRGGLGVQIVGLTCVDITERCGLVK